MSATRRLAFLASVLLVGLSFLGGAARAAPVSPGEGATQELFWIVLIPALGIGIFVSALIAYAVLKFRVRPGHTVGPANPKTHDRQLEALWTVIPAIILLIVGVAAFHYIRNGTWQNLTGDFTSLNTTGGFTIKTGLVVKIILRSFDVAHSFYLIDFDLKVDVIPGHTNLYWFKPLQPGDFMIRCAEFCGLNHYTMTATLHVVP